MPDKIGKIYEWMMAVIIWYALILMFFTAIKDKSGSALIESIVNYFFYFTIESNIMAGIYYCYKIMGKNDRGQDDPFIAGAIPLYLFITGSLYFILLRSIDTRTGIDFIISNTLLHYIIPSGCLAYWALFQRNKNYKIVYSVYWLSYPLFYFIITLLKGLITSKYPYPFLDAIKAGYPRVLITGVILTSVFFVFGLLFILLGRLTGKNQKSGLS